MGAEIGLIAVEDSLIGDPDRCLETGYGHCQVLVPRCQWEDWVVPQAQEESGEEQVDRDTVESDLAEMEPDRDKMELDRFQCPKNLRTTDSEN